VFRSSRPATLNDAARTVWGRGRMGLDWLLGRRGWLTVGAGVVTLFWRTREELATPDVQFHVIPFSADRPGAPLHDFSGWVVSVCQLRPESRGSLELRSAVSGDPPVIRANYLATGTDRQTMVDGLKLIRRVACQPALHPFREAEVDPGPDCRTDADLLAHARRKGGTIFHPAGTCRMGSAADPLAVVDPRLRVHGLLGLRVADASIMPTIVSGNTNAPTIMIGEKAASMIREDAAARS
jgi:choline dehydrogenase